MSITKVEVNGAEHEINDPRFSPEDFFNLTSSQMTFLASGSDLNDLTTPGNFKIGTAAIAQSISNMPYTAPGRLFVIATTSTTRLCQIYIANKTKSCIYTRYYNGTSWSAWDNLASASSVESAFKYAEYDGGDKLGNQSINTVSQIYGITNPTDVPVDVDLSSYVGWLFTYGTSDSISQSNRTQMLFYSHNNALYLRYLRTTQGTWTDWINLTGKKTIKVLIIGNSFNQDVTAYVPPILEEILPDYEFYIGDLYSDGAELVDHITMFDDDTPYQKYNRWSLVTHKWAHTSNKTLADVLAEGWDIIFTQGTSSDVLNDTDIEDNIVAPSRQLLRILQKNSPRPFTYMTNLWHGRPLGAYTSEQMWEKIVDATEKVMDEVGFADYVPVGTALQSARTNSTLKALGDGDMLFDEDSKHIAAGVPALICAYTIVAKILEWAGLRTTGIYKSTWKPTDANCIAIAARGESVHPIVMTHGDSVGVTDANMRAAQEIAVMAVKKPTTITDCSDFIEA